VKRIVHPGRKNPSPSRQNASTVQVRRWTIAVGVRPIMGCPPFLESVEHVHADLRQPLERTESAMYGNADDLPVGVRKRVAVASQRCNTMAFCIRQ